MAEIAIKKEGNKLSPDTYIELYDFDPTAIGGSIRYITNTSSGGTDPTNNIFWKGHNYLPFPLEVTGYDNKSDGTALGRVTMTISNVHKSLIAGVLALGDLVGTKVTRTRTFLKFTDAGSEPNPDAHYPIEIYYITRKIMQNRASLQFELSNVLDRQEIRLPRRQVLKDQGFPGVSRVRIR
jgi:lambda family phage minor tail protein L